MAKKQVFEDFKWMYDTDKKVSQKVLDVRCEDDLCVNPNCKRPRALGYKYMASKKAFLCRYCLIHVYPFSGSIFHGSHITHVHIFQIVYQMLLSRNSASAKEVERTYGYSYNSTFYFMHNVRALMGKACSQFTFDETVVAEIDETGINTGTNGLSRHFNQGKSRKNDKSSTVLAMVERAGRAKLFYINNSTRDTIFQKIKKEFSQRETLIVTDDYSVYHTLSDELGFQHVVVNHSSKQNRFKNGIACTNNCENIFSIVSRMIFGTHMHINHTKLFNYLNEISFKYSYRDELDYGFEILLKNLGSLNTHYIKKFSKYPKLRA